MWVIYALLSAFSLATADALSKKVLSTADEWIVAWVRFLFAGPFLIGFLIFGRIPPLDSTFWLTILVMLPMESVALLMYVRAIKTSPLSLTIPFLSMTPLFLVLTGWLVLGERVDAVGSAGIGLIVLGAYLLHIHTFHEGWLAPLKAIIREKGSRLMILIALIYSFTSSFGKVAILHSSPTAFGAVYFLLLAVVLSPMVLWRSRSHIPQIKSHMPVFFTIGLFEAVMILFHTLAIVQTEVAYMIAVKRTSLIFSVMFGYLFFGETHFRQRLMGSLLMLAGVAVISLR